MGSLSTTDAASESHEPLSSYALMTAERLLSLLDIHLDRDSIASAMRNKQGLYDKILAAPLKNVLNGIVLQQAVDYQVYLQKLFVDYLMSGATTLSEESPGAATRAEIEEHREYVMALGTKLQEHEFAHLSLIANTQKELLRINQVAVLAFKGLSAQIALVGRRRGVAIETASIRRAIYLSVVDFNIEQEHVISRLITAIVKRLNQNFTELEFRPLLAASLSLGNDFKMIVSSMHDCFEKSLQSNASLIQIRSEFFDAIVRMQTLIGLLPGDQLKETHAAANLESIQFDRNIG